MKTHEDVSINEVENWGGLKSPRDHVAAVGARIIDNRSRNLDVVYNRVTVVGRKDAADRLCNWLFSRKTLKHIAKNTRFVWGLDASTFEEHDIKLGKKFVVSLYVRCAGEYCYVAAYADEAEKKENVK